MPLKRQPETLYKLCIEKSILTLLVASRDCKGKILFSNILPVFPPSVLNDLVSDIIDTFVENTNSRDKDGLKASSVVDRILSDLLDRILSDRLTLLDLSSLANLETITPMEFVETERIILKSMSSMCNLVSLTFKANRNTPTLPVCGDELLQEIGFSCPKLKSLDVSYNHTVTNSGLYYLLEFPYGTLSGFRRGGCPELQKLIIFGCAVTVTGVAKVLEHLKMLKFVGYKETGTSVMHLNKRHRTKILNLVYLNNMGCGIKTVEDYHKLHYSCKMSYIICNTCPFINELKVRVTDATLEHVVLGHYVNSVHLFFVIGKHLAIGKGTINFFKNYGAQLTTLSLVCSTISTDHLLKLGKYCTNLETFTIKCGQLYDHDDILYKDFKKYYIDQHFSNLQNFFFTIVTNNDNLGIKFLPYIVYSCMLKNFYFSLNSTLLTDSWVEEFLTLCETTQLESFVIDVPMQEFSRAALTFTMTSVHLVLAKCPRIKTIGNLFAWCINVKEMKELCRLRDLENNDFDLVYRPVPAYIDFQIYN